MEKIQAIRAEIERRKKECEKKNGTLEQISKQLYDRYYYESDTDTFYTNKLQLAEKELRVYNSLLKFIDGL